MTSSLSATRTGMIQALLACLFWGVMPIYFKLLQSVPALEVVSHRIIWSVPLLLLILWLRKNLSGLKVALSDSKTRLYLLTSAILVGTNWLIYVWAVQESHILAASLGYFVSPLLSVFLGALVLKEKLSKNQWIAISIVALGVSILAVQAWQTLWISMALAGSWSLYSLVRKLAPVGPMVGLTVETGLLFPLFLAYFLWLSTSGAEIGFGHSWSIDILLMGGAIMTAIPLLLFASAVQKISLTVMGLLQYLAPSLQFIIAAFFYDEPLTISHIICFALIWISIAIFSADTLFGKPSAAAKKMA